MLLPSAAFMNEDWHLEGYITTGKNTSVGLLTRIQGTVHFSADQIQFNTNIGNFTRQVSLEGMEYNNTKTVRNILDTEYVIESTRVKITGIDEVTMLLNFGKTKSPSEDTWIFSSYEWIGAVLTKRAVSSRLFPFDALSMELWLQPDYYEGQSIAFKSNVTLPTMQGGGVTIDVQPQAYQGKFGGNPLGGFFVEGWSDERTQLRTSANLNDLDYDSRNDSRILVKTIFSPVNPNYPHLASKNEYYETYSLRAYRLIHLGDGRIFWFEAETRLGESISIYTESGVIAGKSDPYITKSNMGCGVLEQKLWFDSPASVQAAPSSSAILETNTKTIVASVEEKRSGAAIVKLLGGEVYQLYLGGRRLLKVGDWVKIGDVIQTNKQSFVKLVFLDKSSMNIGPGSEIKIENFVPKDCGIIDIIKGYIRSEVSKDYLRMRDENQAKLLQKTKNAIFGVRGTEFELSYNEESGIGTTTLQMIEGSVEFTNLITGVTSLVSHQDSIVAQGPINSSGSTGPEINVLGRTLQSLTSGVSVQSLGAVAPAASSEPVVFRIRNVGQTALSGIKPQIRGLHAADFSIVQLPKETLSPLTGEGTLQVIFTPSALGSRQALLEIVSSDTDESPFIIRLEGVGQNPPRH